MKKFKRLILIIAAAVACLCMCFAFAACTEEDTKYDVAIRVACSDGEVYEFPVGEDEKHITIPYDGVERTYWVKEYNLPDHPRYSDDWFSPSGEGANVFQTEYLYIAPDGSYNNDRVVCIQGEYVLTFMADSTSDIWNFRACQLFIEIK